LPKTTGDGLREVVHEAWVGGFSVQSSIARTHAEFVAMAASMQLITTQMDKREYSRIWRVTNKGLRWLNEMKDSK
jgi:hypothetical protein